MAEVYSEEVEFETEFENHSDIIYRYIFPQNTATISTTSGGVFGPTTFIFPPAPTNLEKSSLNFQVQLPLVSLAYNYINGLGGCAVQRMRLVDQFSNAVWMDVSNFNQYCALLQPSGTSLEEFLTKSFYSTVPSSTAATSQLYMMEDMSRFNQNPTVSFLTSYSATLVGSGTYVTSASIVLPTNLVGSYTASNVDLFPQNSFTGRRQYYIGAVGTATYLDFQIPFSAFKFTVLDMDKLFYNPSNLQFEIYWNNTDNYCFSSTSATDPSAVGGSCVAITGTSQINNVNITLANENNIHLVSEVVDKVTRGEGLKLQIPWITMTKSAFSSSTNHSYQIALSTAYGNSLLAIVTAPFASLTSGTNAVNANTHQRGFISSYNSFINNISISNPSFYNVAAGGSGGCQDYMIGNRKFLRGSVVQTLGEYISSEWQHWDSWFGTKPAHEVDCQNVDGLDLRKQNAVFQWQCVLSQSIALNWVSALIGQKTLSLTSQGSLVY